MYVRQFDVMHSINSLQFEMRPCGSGWIVTPQSLNHMRPHFCTPFSTHNTFSMTIKMYKLFEYFHRIWYRYMCMCCTYIVRLYFIIRSGILFNACQYTGYRCRVRDDCPLSTSGYFSLWNWLELAPWNAFEKCRAGKMT